MTDTLDTIRRALCRVWRSHNDAAPCHEARPEYDGCDSCNEQARAVFSALFPDVYKFEGPK